MGGLKVNIGNSFIDKKFPIAGKENDDCGGDDPEFLCRYETVEFVKGEAIMDGETALKYVRSRNAQGSEGNDFARSKRQQVIMDALKEKAIRQLFRFSASQNRKLYQLLDQSTKRDFSNQQAAILFKNIIFKGKLEQKNISLSQEMFEVPNVGVYGKYVLIGKNGDISKIQEYISCEFEKGDKKCLEDKSNQD